MSNLAIGTVGICVVMVLMALRFPIGAALGLVSFVGIWAVTGPSAAWGILSAIPYNFAGSWDLSAVPMFLFMGYVASSSGLTSGLFRTMRIFLARLPGALACASVGACALFSAVSGSSVATSAAMSRIAVPEMLRAKYDHGLAAGVIASAGTLGSLIPPSILLVLYGIFAGVSIGKLFIAAFIPGFLSAAVFMAMIMTRARLDPKLAPPAHETFTREEKRAALKDIWPLPTLVLGVLGGIMAGFFTATEAGAVGALLALAISASRGQLTRSSIVSALQDTCASTASIFFVIIGTALLTRFMALTGVPTALAGWIMSIGSSELFIIFSIAILYLILGCFIDSVGIMLLSLPVVLPILETAGTDLVWFGILTIKLLEIGMITPPVGLNVYVMHSSLNGAIALHTIFRGVAWFIVADLVTFSLLVAFPDITLVLPRMFS